jgi:hypothetical protein
MRVGFVILFVYVIVLDILWFGPLGNECFLEWTMLTAMRLTWGVTRCYGLLGNTDLLSWLDIFAQPLCVSLYSFVCCPTNCSDIIRFDDVLRVFWKRQWVENYEQFIIACNLASLVPGSQTRKFNCLPGGVGSCLSHAVIARYINSNSRLVFYLCGIWIWITAIGVIRLGVTSIWISFLLVALFWPIFRLAHWYEEIRITQTSNPIIPESYLDDVYKYCATHKDACQDLLDNNGVLVLDSLTTTQRLLLSYKLPVCLVDIVDSLYPVTILELCKH